MNATEPQVVFQHDSPIIHTEVNYTMGSNTTSASPMPITSFRDLMNNLPELIKGFEPLLYNPYLLSSVNWFFFGTILETGRRIWQWVVDQCTAGLVLTAIFDTGDPAYEWFAAFLNEEKIWGSTREFRVSARTSTRSWGVSSKSAADGEEGHAAYTPVVDQAQVFWFHGTLAQIKRSRGGFNAVTGGHDDGGQLVLVLYTRKRAVLDDLVETAYSRYKHKDKPRLVIHNTCSCGSWCGTTSKARRPIDSLILPKGVKQRLLRDAREFMRSHAWYLEAGIQHKRGYLLYGLPGTGKSSTIHALASELDLEIYTLSLSTSTLDDSGLARLISATPANSIILIEDIDCAFPSRELQEERKKKREQALEYNAYAMPDPPKALITLSGLLNVLDGVTSEEGRLLFATTNYVDRLDPALLRPGRMDVRLHYARSTRFQMIKLYKRFFSISVSNAPGSSPQPAEASKESPEAVPASEEKKAPELTPPPTPTLSPPVESAKLETIRSDDDDDDDDELGDMEMAIDNPIYPPTLPAETVNRLAREFADSIPLNKYSMAELEGYLVTVRTKPYEAVEGVKEWIRLTDEERIRLREKEKTEAELAEKEKEELERKMKEDEASEANGVPAGKREQSTMTDTVEAESTTV